MATKTLTDADMNRALRVVAEAGARGVYVDYEAAEQATMAMGAIIEAKKLAGFIDEPVYARFTAELEKAYAAIKNDEQFARADFRAASEAMLAAVR
jgi:nickel-dependent lactate racemase